MRSLAEPEDAARIRAIVTVCHGQADDLVGAEKLGGLHAEMHAAKVDYQILSHAGAVHSFTNEDCGAYGMPGVAYDAKADRRSWEHMRLALAEAFAAVEKR